MNLKNINKSPIPAFSTFALIAITVTGCNEGDNKKADPLSLIADGMILCAKFDEQRRTCQSIATYQGLNDQTYISTAIMILSPKEPVTFETSLQVTIKDGAECSVLRPGDIWGGKVRVNGHLLSKNEATHIYGLMNKSMLPYINKEVCTSYVETENGLIAKSTVAGGYKQELDQAVKWVRPSDGYRVAP
jgi:hypothetical protein